MGAVRRAPRKVLQKAMASAGAAVAAMSGADVEMNTTATASNPNRGAATGGSRVFTDEGLTEER